MPAPKRRHSSARGKKRRTHYRAAQPPHSRCPQCGEPRLPHRVCPNCGYYRGEPVILVKEKTE